MKSDKRQTIENARCKVGDAARLLGLSQDEAGRAGRAEPAAGSPIDELLANTRRLADGRSLDGPVNRDSLYERLQSERGKRNADGA